MSVYGLSIFLHVVAALAVFGAMTVEWLAIHRLRGVTGVRQVRETLHLLRPLRFLGLPSMLTLLVTGVYMSATNWGRQPWISLGLLGMVIMGVLGGRVTARRIGALARLLPEHDGPISPELASELHHPALAISLRLRLAIGLGVVFLMTVKPGLTVSVAVLPLFAVAGWIAAARSRGAEPAVLRDGSPPEPEMSR